VHRFFKINAYLLALVFYLTGTLLGQVPDAPELLNPDDGETGLPTSVNFIWQHATSTETYTLQVATHWNFPGGHIIFDQSGIPDTSLILDNLNNNTRYYWRVRASNDDGESDWSATWEFETLLNTYVITVEANPSEGGTVGGGGTFEHGEEITVTASPETGYSFVNWTEDGAEVSTDQNYTFTVTDDRQLVANFTPDAYTISVSANPSEGGTVGGGGTFEHGEEITVTASPETGYSFVNWTEDGTEVSTDQSYTFTVTDNRQLVAHFNFNLPDIPLLVAPPDGETSLSLTPRLEWEEADNADTYRVEVATDDAFGNMVFIADGLTATSVEVEDGRLLHNQQHYWRVRGQNDGGPGEWSDIWRFSTPDRFLQFVNPSQSTVWEENSIQTIRWQSRGVNILRIEYTINNGSNWDIIADTLDASTGSFEWTVPPVPTTEARLRIADLEDENTTATSPVFSIYPVRISIEHSMMFGDPSSVTSYLMVGLPGNNNISMSSVMSGIAGTDWTAFHDDGSEEDYLIEYDGSNAFNFRPGRGFWILSRNVFDYQGNQNAVELNSDNAYEITLHNGWNIIANPFDVEIGWTSVRAQNDITAPIWGFNGSFNQSGTFQPYRGYYFHNDGNLESLSIPYPGGGSQSKQVPALPEIAHDLKFSLTKNGISYSDIAINIAEGYDEHINRYTIYAPPSDFEEASIGMRDGQIHTEVKNPSDEGYTFDIRIRMPENKTYTLNIDGADSFDGYEIALVNRRSGKIIELHRRNSFEVSASSGDEHYKLIIGSERFTWEEIQRLIPDIMALSQNYPNPFNPITTIEYSIPQEKENVSVTIEIFNVLGQRVRTLVRDRHTAGFYSAEWDARNDHGINLPSGVYIYRLQAGEYVESRKMLYLK
jgi:uncharacterized repeat protein (TIGR02543 family)